MSEGQVAVLADMGELASIIKRAHEEGLRGRSCPALVLEGRSVRLGVDGSEKEEHVPFVA